MRLLLGYPYLRRVAATDLELGLTMGLNERRDLICSTGDFVSMTVGFETQPQGECCGAADLAPVRAVLGNHDGGRWLALFGGEATVDTISELVESDGVTLLDDRGVQVR